MNNDREVTDGGRKPGRRQNDTTCHLFREHLRLIQKSLATQSEPIL